MSDSSWLLLDTHIWIWWIAQDGRLPRKIEKRLMDGAESLAISSVSIYEAVLHIRRGRVVIDLPLNEWLHVATVEAGISVMPVNDDIAANAAALPAHHGDPLDRMIIATALYRNALLVSVDGQFSRYESLAGRLLSGKD